ncbi:MAG: hypothetical protein ABIL46_04580 [candidate division WOR-3 bacterium]
MNECLDVIVPSICRPQLIKTYNSFLLQVSFSGKFHFIIHIDVFEKNRKYLPKLLEFLNKEGINDIHINYKPSGFANAMNYLYNRIETPLYFHLEDDWTFLKRVNLDIIFNLLWRNPNITHIRLSKEKILPPSAKLIEKYSKSKEDYLLLGNQIEFDGVGLVETKIWSFNPHLALSKIPKLFFPIPPGVEPENYMCKRYWKEYGYKGLYVFGKYGDSAYIKDIGRPSYLMRKMKTVFEILHNPSLIHKSARIKRVIEYKGRSYNEAKENIEE